MQMPLHMAGVVALEVPIPALMKVDDNRHGLTRTQLTLTLALALPTGKLLLSPLWFKALPEIIDMAKQFQ